MSAAIHSEAIPRDRPYVIEICHAGGSRLPQHEPDPTWHAHIRNTAQITVLKASEKTNVVPAEATAEVDIRILPGQDPETFIRQLREAIDDDRVAWSRLFVVKPRVSSSPKTALFDAIS